MNNYIFTSKRLGLRNWESSDIDLLFAINNNDHVMKFFPSKPNRDETKKFIERMQNMYKKEQFCYFAVDLLKTKEFIGFIGLCKQTYKADFNPSIDIGWRLHPNFWYKGYATEGAKACLEYAFHQLNINKIIAVAPKINIPSITVMKKIGLQKVKEFNHPLLKNNSRLQTCVLYEKRSLLV